MARIYKNLIYSTAEYTRSYQGFKGVELNASASITDSSRLAYAENVYKDYEADGADVIESIPGFRRLFNCGKKIHALYYQRSPNDNDHILVHAEDSLFRYPVSGVMGDDNSDPVSIATLSDRKSFGISFGKHFYIIDGESILRIDENGECMRISDEEATPYVPTTYISGAKYDERNLLCDQFKEEYYIADPAGYLYSSDGLKYTITDPDLHYCSVSGISENAPTAIFIPSYTTISDQEYKVCAIENYAFANNNKITSVHIANGVQTIGLLSFYKCANIEEVVLPSSLKSLGNGAFGECAKLSSLYLGDGIADIGLTSFSSCVNLKTVYYSLDEESYKKIKNISELDGRNVIYEKRYDGITLALKLHDKTESVETVTVNDAAKDFYTISDDEGIQYVIISFSSISDATGIKAVIKGSLTSARYNFASASDDGENRLSGYEAVCGCTVAEVFDGRIFFAGNPALPNTVFYTTQRDVGESSSLYIGRYNYFNDGVGSYNVKCMLAVRDMLAIFKEGDDGSGSIFYHKKVSTNQDSVDTIYPVAYVHSGICAVGPCASFLDDPVFITGEGLYALESENINYQRNTACRSHNVNFKLLKENLSHSNLSVWLGYLALGVNGSIYLADSRSMFRHPTGDREYEWFLLKGIGTYTADKRVYRYSRDSFADAIASTDKAGEIAPTELVYSGVYDDTTYYYADINGVKYLLDPTDEMSGGDFSPARVFISHGKYLFFGSDNGDVCIFNNDKRGIAPDRIKNTDGFNDQEYAELMADKIHPDYYSFAGHAPRYVIKTALDNCEIPHLTKNTVKKSLVIKSKAYEPDNIKCEVVTDLSDPVTVGFLPGASIGFDEFDFDNPPWRVSQYSSVSLPEKEKKWIEKQIILSSDKYCAPISIYSITYRYSIKGKIKNND